MQQTPTEYMKQRELTINLNVTHAFLVKTRRCGNCSDERNFHLKQWVFFNNSFWRISFEHTVIQNNTQ